MNNPLSTLEALATNEVFFDAAIDMTDPPGGDEAPSAADRLATYRRTRDLAALVLKPDAAPTRFVCRQLGVHVVASLEGAPLPRARLNAFVFGCHEVRLPDGKTLRPPGKLAAVAGGMTVPEDEEGWLRLVRDRFGLETIYEIGSVILERARLPEGARGPFSYPAG